MSELSVKIGFRKTHDLSMPERVRASEIGELPNKSRLAKQYTCQNKKKPSKSPVPMINYDLKLKACMVHKLQLH